MSYCCNMWFNHYTSNFNSNRMLLIFLHVFLATIQDNGILRVCYNGLLSRCKDWSIEMKTFTYMYIHVFLTDYLIRGRFKFRFDNLNQFLLHLNQKTAPESYIIHYKEYLRSSSESWDTLLLVKWMKYSDL